MFEKIIAETKARREADAKRFKESDSDLCMICWAYGADKRSMFLSCGYAVQDVIPEAVDTFACGDRGYYLRLCKSCRAAMLGKMREFADLRRALRNTAKDHDGCEEHEETDANIPVRVDGATVMMTAEQYQRWNESRTKGGEQP